MKTLSVIGIGRLGLCAALCFAHSGYRVVGVDINQEYVEKINQKTLNSQEPRVHEYLNALNQDQFQATTNIVEALNNSDYLYIMVDTPTTKEHHYDTKNLECVLK